jgi:hypothetical protein
MPFKPFLTFDCAGFRVVRVPKPIPFKGKQPRQGYSITLADVYAKHKDHTYSRQEADQLLSIFQDLCPGLSTKIIELMFPPKIAVQARYYPRLPIVMGQASPEKREFNLFYQDGKLKLAVEDRLRDESEKTRYEREAQGLMEIVSILLNTSIDHGPELWQSLTDNDLDALVHQVLKRYDSKRKERFLESGLEMIERCLRSLPNFYQMDLRELVTHQVFSGRIWDEKDEALLENRIARGGLAVDDVDQFKKDVLARERCMLFFFSDNSELVWDLALISWLLKRNPGLHVTGIIGTEIMSGNANPRTLDRCLQVAAFQELRTCSRFELMPEDNLRSAIDLNYCSKALLERISQSDLALVKGVSAFEVLQGLAVDAYYGFAVSTDAQRYTGYQRGDGIFVRVPKGHVGYDYANGKTLRELYQSLQKLPASTVQHSA